MISFNSLLKQAGLDLARTKLVRHQSVSDETGLTPFDLWKADDGRFEFYQRTQRRDIFKGADFIASFVATPMNETLFLGVFNVLGRARASRGAKDALCGNDIEGLHLYDLHPADILSEYRGRMIVDWGPGFRSWVQWAHSKDKAVRELRPEAFERPFPGFEDFGWSIRELASVPASWRTALASVGGVYLLVCRRTGRQYVGAAYGEGGFWARWENYFRTGHGGNQAMKKSEDHDYWVSILEFTPSSFGVDDIIALEARWKQKLLTRPFGLNLN